MPAFIGFVAAGVPIGVTMSFLIASPLVNEIAIGLLLTLLAFMMAVVALSLLEMILLRQVPKPQLLAIFITTTGFGIIAVDEKVVVSGRVPNLAEVRTLLAATS